MIPQQSVYIIIVSSSIGQNAAIFEALTAPLRNMLPKHYEYVFLDGPEDCDPYPTIAGVFPGPYHTWYSEFETKYMAEQHVYVTDFIEEEGESCEVHCRHRNRY